VSASLSVVGLALAPAASAAPTVLTYTSTTALTVPAGVTSIKAEVIGGGGGSGWDFIHSMSGAPGGAGADLTTTLAVTPGQVLGIAVGGAGFDASGSSGVPGGPGVGGLPIAAGGNGGSGTHAGGGGGGAASGLVDSISSKILAVAPGGGGGGGEFFTGDGGGGGSFPNSGANGHFFGFGDGAGGVAGASEMSTPGPATSSGGNGGSGLASGGGGGGGGCPGGGGGTGDSGAGAGGGGGSGGWCVNAFFATATTVNAASGPFGGPDEQGEVIITYTIAPPLALAPQSLPAGTVGSLYPTQTLLASGGTPPYTFDTSPISGSLPPGISLSASGAITGTPSTAGTYNFTVQVSDSSIPAKTATQSYSITVKPPPLFFGPSSLPGGLVGHPYSGSLSGSGGTPPYSFNVVGGSLPPGLTLNPTTGAITGTPSAAGTHAFKVTLTDSSTPQQSVTQTFSITVASPALFFTPQTLPNGTVGVAYPPQTLSVTGGTPPYSFALSAGTLPPGLSLNSLTGVISGTPTTAGTYSFTVTATDSSSPTHLTAMQSFTVVIEAPALVLNPAVLPDGVVGHSYAGSVTFSGGTSPYSASVFSGALPPGLSLGTPSAGTLGIGGTPTAAGTYSFGLRLTDSSTPPQSAENFYTITVVTPLTLGPPSLPNGQKGVAYSASVVASGGTPPYSYAKTAGTLPAGLSLNSSTGALSGTPTAAATYHFTITATDSSSPAQTASVAYTVVISPPAPVVTLSPLSLPDGTVGHPYSVTFSASGGTPPYTFTKPVGSLPPGLSLNHSTGALTGTPTTAGTFSFTIKVTDSASPTPHTASIAYTLVISKLLLSPATLPNGTVATPYSVTLIASGGSPPYAYNVSGSLPPGLSLNSLTGVLSGTPTTAGTYSFSIVANDSHTPTPNSVTNAYTVVISPAGPLTITTTSLPAATVGHADSATLGASGGTPPYTWLAKSTLPPGLSLSSAGVLSGTPTKAGSYTFSVEVKDSASHTDTKFVTLTVS
jgi:hypothetical protein